MNKYQKALENFNNCVIRKENDYPINSLGWEITKKQKDSYSLLQELVDKATPKKPIYKKPSITFFIPNIKLPHCPECNTTVTYTLGCENNECRQAIDWSDKKEYE